MCTVRRQDGFTLIELMMATAITLIVLATATGTFKHALQLNETATLTADANQNLRSGANVFIRDLMQAGRGIPSGGIPIPSGANTTALVRPAPLFDPAVTLAFDNTTQATLPAIIPGYQLGPVVNGRPTDIVTMLALDPTSYVAYPAGKFKQLPLSCPNPDPSKPLVLRPGVTAPAPTLAADGASLDVGQFSTWISDPVNGIKAGDLLLFNNPAGPAIQTVTGVTGTTVLFAAGDAFNFNQRSGVTQGSIVQLIGSTGRFPVTEVVRIQMLSYYLDNLTTPGAPHLMRQLNFFEPQALAGVVDDLAITYDLLDDPTNPVYPVRQTSVTSIDGRPFNASRIRKANLRLAVRSESRSTVNNQYLRNTSNTVVSVRGLAYSDRYEQK